MMLSVLLTKLSPMKIQRIISIVSLALSLITLVLILKKPQPVATPQAPAALAANAQSFQNKLEQLEHAKAQGQAEAEIRFNSDEINAALIQASGTMPAASSPRSSQTSLLTTQASPAGQAQFAPVSNGSDQPTVKDYQVSFEGDVVKGQFLVQVAGKDLWVTVAGHLGAKDGYATFEPTQFKLGDMNVPVSLVNDTLQKKLVELRDQLKLPDYVGDLKVENGELVMRQK
jgi:hypothetical protein